MKFKSINLINFRQFSGENKLEFSTLPDKNLTIIHAMNGSGKTTLLQAFNWALYGKLNLPDSDKILNETIFQQMVVNEEKQVVVTLEASHEDINYSIERKRVIKKIDENKQKVNKDYFRVTYTDKNGNSQSDTDSDAENIINSILPEKLSTYFLFDGERIKNLGENNAKARRDISTGIKNILNIDVYDSLKDVLEKKLMNLLNAQLKSNGASEVLLEKTREHEAKTNELESAVRNINQFENDIVDLRDEIKKLEEEIKLNEQAEKLQKEYDDKKEKKDSLEEEINMMLFPGSARSYPSLSKFYTGYTLTRLLSIIESDVKLKLDSSSIPEDTIPGMNAIAIDAIIEKKNCICGRKITETEIDKLNSLKHHLPPHDHKVLIQEFKTRYDEKLTNVEHLEEDKESIFNIYFAKDSERDKLKADLQLLDRQLSNVKDIKNLYEQKKLKQTYLEEKITKLALEEINRDNLKEKLEELRLAIELSTKNNLENKKVHDLIAYNKDLITILTVTINQRKQAIHQKLNDEVNHVFNNASHKKSKEVIIDESYNYTIRDKVTKSEALSEGESIITSLSLIAAILKIAKDQMKSKTDNLDHVVEYPLILDAPFAKLDIAHISGIAPLLPKFSDQVILFSIDQQFKGTVEESVKDVIGKQYEMINNQDKNVEFKEI